MIYYTFADRNLQRRPEIQRHLSLDDYLQLQLLLRHEQHRREQEEKYRLACALHNLKVLKENYRRERAQRIQRYMDYYLPQALLEQQRQEEAYYRSCLASALEQRRAQELWQQYQHARLHSEDMGFEDFHSQQLARTLKLLFGQFDDEQEDEIEKKEQQEKYRTGSQQYDDDIDDESRANELWNLILQQQQQQQHEDEDDVEDDDDDDEDEDEDEEEEEDFEDEDEDEDMADEVEPESVFASKHNNNASSMDFIQDETPAAAGIGEPEQPKMLKHGAEPDNTFDDVRSAWPRQQQSQPEPLFVSSRGPSREAPNRVDASSPPNRSASNVSPPPPLQDRVLNLKDLLDQLVEAHNEVPEARQQEVENIYAPKHVVTEAEPTVEEPRSASATEVPAASIPATAGGAPAPVAEEEETEPGSAPSPSTITDSAAERVHQIAEQQKQNLPPTEPKIHHPQLEAIEEELNTIEKQRLDPILQIPLQFTRSGPEQTLQLTATTKDNREFLGCEDQIMRAMLKLDAIPSDGDLDIRNKRRTLVKKAETMLEKLDELKEKEWRKARIPAIKPTKAKGGKKKKHHKHKNKHRHR